MICSATVAVALSDATHAVIESFHAWQRKGQQLARWVHRERCDNIYTQTAPFKDLILKAYADADKLLGGRGSHPRKAEFGANCQVGDDCQSANVPKHVPRLLLGTCRVASIARSKAR